MIDAARADHLGCYGYPRGTTPNIDAIAEESQVFTRHFCQATQTKPSTASLFTSQYPHTHLTLLNRGVEQSTLTIARGLAAAGFQTALFSSNVNASPEVGLGHRFQESYARPEVQKVLRGKETQRSPEPLLRLFRGWLRERGNSRFFAYVHLLPPHRPYAQPGAMTDLFKGRQPPGFREDKYTPGEFDFPITRPIETGLPPLPEWINLYDANLRYGDWAVGEIVSLLREYGVFDNTVFVVTSDHGEAFGEHGFVLHGPPIHDEVSHIPLLIRIPGRMAGQRIDALTESIDLLPTVFDLLEVPYPEEGIQGRSLLPLIAGDTDKVRDHVFTRSAEDAGKYMVRGLDHSLLLFGNGKWRALYDLETDPEQRHNVMADQPAVADELLEVFRAFVGEQRLPPVNFLDPSVEEPPLPAAGTVEVSPELRKELRALGYLD